MTTREEFDQLVCDHVDAVVNAVTGHPAHRDDDGPRTHTALLAAWDALHAEVERERMRLAACGVVAQADTPDSSARARDMLPEYRSASCDDVARMVDNLMDARERVAALHAEVERLRTGVPLTAENAPRARVVECGHCAFIRGDDGSWGCNGWEVDVDYLLVIGATVLAWRKP